MQETNEISGIEFGAEGLTVTYVRVPRDIRKNGLIWQHQVGVPHGSDYGDEIEALTEAAQALLTDVLDDEDRAEPIEQQHEEEEADDE